MKKFLRPLLAAALVLGFAGVAAAAEKVTVVLEYPYPDAVHTGLRLAEVKGWYKEAGLDVDIQMGKGSVVTIQQTAAGSADIGVAQLSAVAASISSGLPVTSIMGMAQYSDLAVIMGTDTGFKTVNDLKGKKLASPSGGTSNVLLPSFFAKAGVSPSDVSLTNVDGTAILTAFTSKSVDGAINGFTYFLPRVEEKRPGVALKFSDVGLNLPGYGLMTKLDTIKSRPDMLKKMIAINQRAWEYIRSGHEQEGVDALLTTGEQYRPDGKVLMAELKLLLPLFETPNTKGHPIGWQSDKDWQEALTLMEEVKLVKAGWKISDYYTNQFVPQK